MKKVEYPIVIYTLCEEDGGGFMALAPDLVGCRGDGETIVEAVACLHDAMDEWADEMRRLGRGIDEPFSLGDRYARDDKALRELVNAQASLIKLQEEALKDQNASIAAMKEEIAVLTAGLSMTSSSVTVIEDLRTKTIGGTAATRLVPERMIIVRRQLVAH